MICIDDLSKLTLQGDKEDPVNDFSYFGIVIYKCNEYVSSVFGDKCETTDD